MSFNPLPLPQEVINGVQLLTQGNPAGIDMREHNQRPFLDASDSNKENSPYNGMDDEEDKHIRQWQ